MLIAGLLAGLAASAASISKVDIDPVDPEAEKRWLVAKLASRPRLAAFVRRRLDRTTAGGLFLTVGFVTVLALTVTVGVVFDMVDDETGLASYDAAVARFGAASADTFAEEIQQLFTHLGGTLVIGIVALVVGLWGWWKHDNLSVLLFMLTVVAGQGLLNTGLKLLVGRDRPDVAQLAPFSGSSFPSGHTAAAAATYAAVAVVLTLGASPRFRAMAAGAAAFLAVGVAATRALLGVHWLTDVIAGLALGYGWFLVCALAFGGRIMRFGEPAEEMAATANPAGDHG